MADIELIKKIFGAIDNDKSGTITDVEMVAVFKLFDADGS